MKKTDNSCLTLKYNSFYAVICCQVLEHIPFENFSVALNELHRVARKRILLSLLQRRKHFKIEIRLPFLGDRKLILKHPVTKKNCTSRQHFWEIGRGCPEDRF